MSESYEAQNCPLMRRLIMLLADHPVPMDPEGRAHLLGALSDLEEEAIETDRPEATLAAIRAAQARIDLLPCPIETGQDDT